MTFREMLDAVKVQGGVDTTTSGVTEAEVKAWLNLRYRAMVARAKWRDAELDLGTTTIDQAEISFTAADVVDLDEVLIDGVPYSRTGRKELVRLKAGWLTLRGPGGVFAPDFTSSGGVQLEVWPAPDEDGLSIVGVAALQAAELVNDADVPITPYEFHEPVVDGAIATALARVDERPDEAAYFEQRYEAAVEGLRRRRNERFGSGPTQIQVQGVHF